MAKTKTRIEGVKGELATTTYMPDDPTGVGVIMTHGFRSDRSRCAQSGRYLSSKGILCLTVDLGGHGQSEGDLDDFSVNDHVEDVVSAYDYMKEQHPVDAGRIALAGISYGGYVGLLASDKRDISSLFLRAAPLYPNAYQDKPRREYSDTDVLQKHVDEGNNALNILSQYKKPVTLVTSGLDEVVPSSITDEIAIVPEVVEHTIEAAGHVLKPNEQKQYMSILASWAIGLTTYQSAE